MTINRFAEAISAGEDNPDVFNQISKDLLPDHMGIHFTRMKLDDVEAEFEVQKHHLAPNGFLHGGSVVSLADTVAGYATGMNLPKGASGFTTIELKTNYFGTARDGVVKAVGTPLHLGRTTQVWDVRVFRAVDDKTIAMFRCTQMILYPKG